jgi:hypothetical protein
MHLPEGREDFHTLSWLEYANLMNGKFDAAKKNVELAKQASDRNATNAGIKDGYLGMRARYILETGQWEKMPVEAPGASTSEEHATMPGMAGRYNGSATWTFIAGFSAAKLGDAATADKAVDELHKMATRTEATNAYAAKPIAIMERQVAAASRLARGQKDDAVRLAKEAADIELTMNAPSGPPDPIKPSLELYGDVLLDAGRAKEAAAAYEDELLRTPNRTPSVKGLASAKEKLRTTTTSAAR